MLIKYNHLKLFLITLGAIVWAPYSIAGCGQNINGGIQKIIDDIRIKQQIPGLSVSISCPGEAYPRDFVSGSTTIAGTSPIQPNHLFQIGSITKSFIATIILQLEAEGQLTIYDPIGKYLNTVPAAWQGVTIQQLLNNTSGLYDYLRTNKFWATMIATAYKKQWSSNELINFSLPIKPNFSPGLGWDYSSTNYVLAGLLIQSITGTTLEQEIEHRFLKPMQLSNTYYLPAAYNDAMLQRMAHGYSALGLFPKEPYDITTQNISFTNAAGAMISTPHDMAIWIRHLFTTESVLQVTQQQELFSLVDFIKGQKLPTSSNKRGYGLGIFGTKHSPVGELLWSDGLTLGYRSFALWFKCHDVVITGSMNHLTKADINLDLEGQTQLLLLASLMNYIHETDPTGSCATASTINTQTLIKLIQPVKHELPLTIPLKAAKYGYQDAD